MQVKFMQQPIQPTDLFEAVDVLVLPIFISNDQYSSIIFDLEARQQLVFEHLKSNNVRFISLPDNIAVLFIAVRPKHNKKTILKNAMVLYEASISEENTDALIGRRFPGLISVFVAPANGAPTYDYVRFPKHRSSIIIYTGYPRLDSVLSRKIRKGAFNKYTPDSMQHPTVRSSLQSEIFRIGAQLNLDVEIINIIRHKEKVFVTCDVMEMEVL